MNQEDYKKVTEYIFNLKRFGDIKLRLNTVRELLRRIGDSHKNFKSIHVGGTNGKGSTAAMIASILQSSGYRVGLFTSPHLSNYNERIAINGEKISEDKIVQMIKEFIPLINQMNPTPTFFEVTTVLAMKYFSEQKVDFAVFEVGIGGRLDATNVITPLVSVITNVSLEHTEILGNTVKKIAKEKGGIIKENGILVTAADSEALDVFESICKRKNSKIIKVGKDVNVERINSSLDGQKFRVRSFQRNIELFMHLLGDYQLINAATAVAAIEALKFHGIDVSDDAIKSGMESVKWPGRMELVQLEPLVILDCAKDSAAARSLKESILRNFPKKAKLILVISISSDKNIQAVIKELVPIADRIVITKHKVMNRAADTKILTGEVSKYSKSFVIVEDVKDAVDKGIKMAGGGDVVLVTGSIFTVGEARELWYKEVNLKFGREFNES
jgi:dihydrofolate synthase/folylpolyglutamate synthase